MLGYNIDNGYVEGILRGYRGKFLTTPDYANLCQCETLEDVKMHLQSTDYGEFLANEPSPLHTTTISAKCTEKMVNEFELIRNQATKPLLTFLDYITYGYMIDNIVLLITGTLHERDVGELVEKCHPLGWFDSMQALTAATSVDELYSLVLIDTPLAPYFRDCFVEGDLNEMNIEIIRNTLYKAYLEDFFAYCVSLGGTTAEIMQPLLEFEADRRAINITINSFGTELTKDQRMQLYPAVGKFFPAGTRSLERADDIEAVKTVVDAFSVFYGHLFSNSQSFFGEDDGNDSKSLEDAFFEYEVKVNQLSFDQLFHFGIYYSFIKLKEQEIRNIVWICECIAQQVKDKINNYIPIFRDY